MIIIQRKRRGGEERERWWVFAGVGSGERTRYISIFSDFIQRLHAIIFFPITIQEQYAKRWSELISGREMKGKVFEAVLICPCWCCFCILPTPDGYRSKVGANQGFPQTHMEISIREHGGFESEIFLSILFYVFKPSNTHLKHPRWSELCKVPQRNIYEAAILVQVRDFGDNITEISEIFLLKICSHNILWRKAVGMER